MHAAAGLRRQTGPMIEPDPTSEPITPARAALITPETARQMQAAAAAKRAENNARGRQAIKEARDLARTVERLELQLGEARAQLVEAKADARAARAETAAIRKRLESRPVPAPPSIARRSASPSAADVIEATESAALVAVRTLSAVLRSLATAARTGEAWRSGADAGALLDAITRAAAAVQALQERAAATPAGRRAAAIETGEVGGMVEALRARLSLPTPIAQGAPSTPSA